jgi:hypothetical protein
MEAPKAAVVEAVASQAVSVQRSAKAVRHQPVAAPAAPAGTANELSLIDPQNPFMSNCKQLEINTSTDVSVLSWNLVGTVIKRQNNQYTVIDVDFTDRNFHRNLCFNDDFKASMVCMNYSGLLMANKGEMEDQDEYAEDLDQKAADNEVDKKLSYMHFKPFNETK